MSISKTRARDADGMSPREREFARLRRADPAAPNWKIAQDAGYEGSQKQLTERARQVLKVAAVRRAVYAPRTKSEELRAKPIDQLTDAELGLIIKQTWLDIARSTGASPGDRARSAAMLGKTIAKFFVPLEVNARGVVTMEDIVREMGGAPEDARSKSGPEPQEVH